MEQPLEIDLDETEDELSPEQNLSLGIPGYTDIISRITSKTVTSAEISNILDSIHLAVLSVNMDPNACKGKDKYFKQVRLLIFALEHNLETLSVSFHQKINEICAISGRVPILNEDVTASITAKGRTLPTLKKNPIWHNETEVKDNVAFYRKDDKSIVRELLLHEEIATNGQIPPSATATSTSSVSYYYISHANGTYYAVSSDLHADHLQPSIQIIAKQLEFIEAMNTCPNFAVHMQAQYPQYFQKEGTQWYGTRKFFLDYHNCLDNLWLLNGGANVGKQSSDPIDYLKNHHLFGEPFFNDLEKMGPISQAGIIYTVNGIPLAKLAKQWFAEKYELTRTLTYLHSVSGEMLREGTFKISQIIKDTPSNRAAVNNSTHEFNQATILGQAAIEYANNRAEKRKQSDTGHISDSDTNDSFEEKIDIPVAKKVISHHIDDIMDMLDYEVTSKKTSGQQKVNDAPDIDNDTVFNAGL